MITLAAQDIIAGSASIGTQLTCTIFGMELNGTTEVYKVLYQGQLAESPATIYTAPISNTAFIKSISIVNNDNVSRTFRFYRGGIANLNSITPDFTLVAQGMASYEDSLGWQFFNSSGQLLTGVGVGVITGGISNQALTKINSTDYNVQWATIDKTFVGLSNVDNTSNATERAATATLTNKRITKRIQSVTDAATITPAADSDDCVDITAIAQAFTIANPTGTPTNLQSLIIRIKDNGTARAITWGNGYVAGGVALPSTTVLSKILTLGFFYNTANNLNKWQCVASSQEA